MIGFLFGAICLFALVRVARWGAWHRYHGMGGGMGGCHGARFRHGCGGRGGVSEESMAKAAGEVFKRRLGITEDQEGIVEHALVDLRAALKELMEELKATREGLVGAFKGEAVDDAALASAFARHDDAVASARRQVVSALKQIHAVLTPAQRARATDWASAAGGRWV